MIQIQLQHSDPRAVLEASSGADSRTGRFQPFGEDGLTFRDLIDIVNPLQHIPLLGTVYRKLTGDSIDPAIRVAGGALFGGPLGAIVSAAAVAIGESRRQAVISEEKVGPQVADRPAPRANTAASATGRGGWMVAAARGEAVGGTATPTQRDARQLSLDTGREVRRGGWIVVQAYGGTERAAADELSNQREAAVDLAV